MQKFLKHMFQYSTQIKYGLLVVILFSMLISIRTYLNYVSIETEIDTVNNEEKLAKEEMFYVDKFLIKYLSSSYADYFLNHENNILLPGEIIIKFEKAKEKVVIQELTGKTIDDNGIKSARESWNYYIMQKLSKYIK